MEEKSDEKTLVDTKNQLALTEVDSEKDVVDPNTGVKKLDIRNLEKAKLPKFFRKAYSERKFKRRVLKPVSIPVDKALLVEIFEKGAYKKKKDWYAVREDRLFTKREILRLRVISKDIAKKKGRFALLPFAALVGVLFLLCSTLYAVKNPLLKKVLKTVAQDAIGAKVDIAYLDLNILDANLVIKGVAVGNKNDVMKNIVEFDTLNVDFDLAQALRGKFDAQNLQLTGIALGTARQVSCELAPDERKENKNSLISKDSELVKDLAQKSQNALKDLQAQAFDMLGGSDVEEIVYNLRSQLTSLDAATDAKVQVEDLVTKWKDKPDEIKTQVESYVDTVKKIQDIDVKKINDIEVLKEYIQTITSIVEQTKSLKDTAMVLKNEVVADGNNVRAFSTAIVDAVKSDKTLLQNKLNTIVSTVTNAKLLLNTALDTVAYNFLGEYYPYVKVGTDYAQKLKENALVQAAAQKLEEKASEKKAGSNRLAGKTFWYKAQNPTFLIEKAVVSGTDFSAKITEITNDQDARGKPTVVDGNFKYFGVTHAANLVLDIRSNSNEPVVKANYKGNGIKALFNGAKIAALSGVPSLDGLMNLELSASAGVGFLKAFGSVDLNPVKLTTDGFKSEFVSKYYRQALDSVKDMIIGYDFDFKELEGITLKLMGDFADKFADSLKGIVEDLGTEAKDKALNILNNEIDLNSNEYFVKAKDFLGIEGNIDLQNTRITDIQNILLSKRTELENMVTEMAKSKVQEAVKDVLGDKLEGNEKLNNAVNSVIDGLSGEAADAASKLFNKIKR